MSRKTRPFLHLLLAFLLVLSASSPAFGAGSITVYVNGQKVTDNLNIINDSGKTLIPLRLLTGTLGAEASLEKGFLRLTLPGFLTGSDRPLVFRIPVRQPSVPSPQPQPDPQPQPEPKPQPQPEPEPAADDSEHSWMTAEERQMLDLINAERVSRGLGRLEADRRLTELARLKSEDMIDLNYFAHQSPTYGSPFDMMKEAGISYRIAGENLAGAPTVERAHQALMNSPGHRANILRPEFTRVGIGIIHGGRYGMMFTQMFNG